MKLFFLQYQINYRHLQFRFTYSVEVENNYDNLLLLLENKEFTNRITNIYDLFFIHFRKVIHMVS